MRELFQLIQHYSLAKWEIEIVTFVKYWQLDKCHLYKLETNTFRWESRASPRALYKIFKEEIKKVSTVQGLLENFFKNIYFHVIYFETSNSKKCKWSWLIVCQLSLTCNSDLRNESFIAYLTKWVLYRLSFIKCSLFLFYNSLNVTFKTQFHIKNCSLRLASLSFHMFCRLTSYKLWKEIACT